MWFKSSFTIPAVVVIGFWLIGGTVPAAAYADLGDQLFTLLSNDGAVGDAFRISVAISGDTAIVGVYAGDDRRAISVDLIMKVAGRIERMGGHRNLLASDDSLHKS